MSVDNKTENRKPKNNHCPSCGSKKSCGRYHVYVIELDRSVLDDLGYCKGDREHITEDSRFFYVGQSIHMPSCRYNQHTVKSTRKRKGRKFSCSCKKGVKELIKFTAYNSGSNYVRQHHQKGGLRPEFYSHINPIIGDKAAAELAEEQLALFLKSLGHAAHWN
jgi:hypothetical protein